MVIFKLALREFCPLFKICFSDFSSSLTVNLIFDFVI